MILVHSGNRIDHPDRVPARFPARREKAVAARLGELLDLLAPTAVVTAAAAGADLLVAEAAWERSVPLHVVLPCPRQRFREVSVADQGQRWASAFDLMMDHVTGDERSSLVALAYEPDDAGFRRGNQALLDRATSLDAGGVLAVAVRPAVRSSRPSVTDDFVDRARAAGLFVVEIDPGPGGPHSAST